MNGDTNLAKAFGSAAGKPGLSTRGGGATLNHDQIEQRIGQLRAAGGHYDTIAELQRGKTAIEAKTAARSAGETPGRRWSQKMRPSRNSIT